MCASGVPPIWHDVVATHLRMRSTSVLERGPARVIASGAKQRRPTPDAGLHHGCVPRHDEKRSRPGLADAFHGGEATRLTTPTRERALVVDHLYGRREPARACRGKTGAGSTTGGRRSARCRPTQGRVTMRRASTAFTLGSLLGPLAAIAVGPSVGCRPRSRRPRCARHGSFIARTPTPEGWRTRDPEVCAATPASRRGWAGTPPGGRSPAGARTVGTPTRCPRRGQPADQGGADAAHAEREAKNRPAIMPTRPGTSSWP